MPSFWNTLFGSPQKKEQLPTLNPQQQQMWQQMMQAMQGPGAGGGYGGAADYYRSLLAGDSGTEQAMAAPMQREFREQTIPGLAEQFAGMGSGGLSSSSFRNAGTYAGVDLAERLANLRASLRGQGAAGLIGMQNQMMNPTMENLYRPATPGLIGGLFQGAGQGIGQGAGGLATQWAMNKWGGDQPQYGKPLANDWGTMGGGAGVRR